MVFFFLFLSICAAYFFGSIFGAFSSSSNANKLGEKLRAQGYNPKVGLARGMNLVSVKSYATKQEAQNAISTLSEVAPKGWVFEWPD
jgi:cell division protein FtsN